MAEFTVQVPDQEVEQFLAWAAEHRYPYKASGLEAIPQWQIDETLRREALNKPEDYRPWSELRQKYGR